MSDFDTQREQFMAGIRKAESGGRYNLAPNAAGASGAYQFLDSTWGGYGGYHSAYQAPPEIQDERARQLMGAYYRQFGTWGAVAQAWLGGPGSVGKNVRDNYTGITSNQYAARVLSYAGLDGSSPAPTTAAPEAPTPNAAPAQPAQPTGPDYHDLGTQLESFMSLLGGPPNMQASLGQTDLNSALGQPAASGVSGG